MSDFLSRLVERNQGDRESIRPRLGSLFEPTAGRAETPSIMPDAPASPSFPTLEAAPHLPEGSEASPPLQQAPDHSTTLFQPQQLPEPVLPQPSPAEMPTPAPGSDVSSAIPPRQHEHRRRTVNAEPAIPTVEMSWESMPDGQLRSSESDIAPGVVTPQPSAPKLRPDDLPKAAVRLATTAITPNPHESTSLNAPEPPSPQQLLDAAPIRSPGMTEQSPSLTVSPRQEIPGNTSPETNPPQLPVTPQMQPLPAFSQPAPKPPTIQVTIGRIDVRAQTPERHQPHLPPTRTRPRPALSLDDYLKQRGESS